MPTTAKTLRALRAALAEAERRAKSERWPANGNPNRDGASGADSPFEVWERARAYSQGKLEGIRAAQRLVEQLCQ